AARSDDPAVAAQALRQRLCLEQTWLETDANLVGLAARTPALVRDAVDDLVTILPPTGCTGAHVPSVPAPPAPAIAARVRAIDARLREIATVLAPLTRLAEVRALGAEVGALGDGALASRWHSALASALMLGGDTAGALAELEQTARLAEAAGDDDGHARAMLDRLRVGFSRGDGDLERLRADAEAAAQRLGNPAIDAEVALGVALMQISRGDAATARRAIEGALARYEPIAIDAHARIIAMWQNLGGACQAMGDLDAAQRAFDRGLALAHARWGDDHPETLELRGARATNLMYRGDLAAAEPELVAVAAGLTRQLGLASPTVMQARAYLCELALERRDPARALAACRDALASGEAAFGADSPQLGWPLTLQAQAQLASGAPADAVRSAERALAGYAHGTLAPTDIPLAQAYLAIALDRTGARDRARALAGSVARTLASMPDLAATLAELRAQFPGLPSE
ncbi:MAG: hypothetical protein K8W52_41920, partial [Deltaproteobacteria bacterium]|nr:hypothetical protein [Deltaproteobacteria bacterium]